MTRMKRAEMAVFAFSKQKSTMTIRRHQVFIMFCRGHAPTVCDLGDPGTYEIDIETLKTDAPLPIAVGIFPRKHVKAVTAMPLDAVASMLDACGAEIRRGPQ